MIKLMNHSRDPEYLDRLRRQRQSMLSGFDKKSFILGMITAFSECVAGGCKRLALSPPLTQEDYTQIVDDAHEIIEKHGLLHYHEKNMDQPEGHRFDWILIAGKQYTIDQYLDIRAKGYSPMDSLTPFSELLSYNQAESINTGYDAYREIFPIGVSEEEHV